MDLLLDAVLIDVRDPGGATTTPDDVRDRAALTHVGARLRRGLHERKILKVPRDADPEVDAVEGLEALADLQVAVDDPQMPHTGRGQGEDALQRAHPRQLGHAVGHQHVSTRWLVNPDGETVLRGDDVCAHFCARLAGREMLVVVAQRGEQFGHVMVVEGVVGVASLAANLDELELAKEPELV